jgi:hypothetical protein
MKKSHQAGSKVSPEAHPQLLGQVALAEVGVLFEDAHDPEFGVFLDPGLATGHWGRLPRYRRAAHV